MTCGKDRRQRIKDARYAAGCDFIVTTGGLSIDPDDVTRQGVRASGAQIISYGSPVLPGAMFLNARLGDVPILGVPACVFYHPRTVFDLMLPPYAGGPPARLRMKLPGWATAGFAWTVKSVIFRPARSVDRCVAEAYNSG